MYSLSFFFWEKLSCFLNVLVQEMEVDLTSLARTDFPGLLTRHSGLPRQVRKQEHSARTEQKMYKASRGCHQTLPWTWWLAAAETCSLAGLEASIQHRGTAGLVPSGSSKGEHSSHLFLSFWGLWAILRVLWLVDPHSDLCSIVAWPSPLGVSVSQISFFCKDTSHWI